VQGYKCSRHDKCNRYKCQEGGHAPRWELTSKRRGTNEGGEQAVLGTRGAHLGGACRRPCFGRIIPTFPTPDFLSLFPSSSHSSHNSLTLPQTQRVTDSGRTRARKASPAPFSRSFPLREGIKGQHAHSRSCGSIFSSSTQNTLLIHAHLYVIKCACGCSFFFGIRFGAGVWVLDGGAQLFSLVN
jgi:hypothetical protein